MKSAIKNVSGTEKDKRSALKAKEAAAEVRDCTCTRFPCHSLILFCLLQAHQKAIKVEQKLREELTKLTSSEYSPITGARVPELMNG